MIVLISINNEENPKIGVYPPVVDELLNSIDEVNSVIVSKFDKLTRIYIRRGNVFKVFNEDCQVINDVPENIVITWLKQVLEGIQNGKLSDISII